MRSASSIRRLAGLLAACGLLVAATAPVGRSEDAERAEDAELAREAVGAGTFVPVDTLLDWIEARYLGRVIEVELEDEEEEEAGDDEPPTYEIEWLTPQQRVIEFEFDARTGQLLEIEGRGIEEALRP
jgi:uncharacterized membrane protein YkoI